MGSLSKEVKPRHEETSPRTVSGIINLSDTNAREPRRTPGSQEEHLGAKESAREALSNRYELTFSVWGPTGHVIYSQM
jgi:hypothetical protein